MSSEVQTIVFFVYLVIIGVVFKFYSWLTGDEGEDDEEKFKVLGGLSAFWIITLPPCLGYNLVTLLIKAFKKAKE